MEERKNMKTKVKNRNQMVDKKDTERKQEEMD